MLMQDKKILLISLTWCMLTFWDTKCPNKKIICLFVNHTSTIERFEVIFWTHSTSLSSLLKNMIKVLILSGKVCVGIPSFFTFFTTNSTRWTYYLFLPGVTYGKGAECLLWDLSSDIHHCFMVNSAYLLSLSGWLDSTAYRFAETTHRDSQPTYSSRCSSEYSKSGRFALLTILFQESNLSVQTRENSILHLQISDKASCKQIQLLFTQCSVAIRSLYLWEEKKLAQSLFQQKLPKCTLRVLNIKHTTKLWFFTNPQNRHSKSFGYFFTFITAQTIPNTWEFQNFKTTIAKVCLLVVIKFSHWRLPHYVKKHSFFMICLAWISRYSKYLILPTHTAKVW